MSIVTPVPEDPNEKAAKRWQHRQSLQAILTSLTNERIALGVGDPALAPVMVKVDTAMSAVMDGMELLSPTPKPRVRTKRKPHLWDK